MLSKAADRSRRKRREVVNQYSIDEMIVDIRKSCFGGMVVTVSRLIRI